MTLQSAQSEVDLASRGTLGFVGATCTLAAVFAAAGVPIPLYETYRREAGVTNGDLALTVVIYFVSAAAALLVLGRLSDHLGRRVVAFLALTLSASGSLVLMQVGGPVSLTSGRALQGVAVGLASSGVAAYIVDSTPARAPRWLGSTVASLTPLAGLTIGSLCSGALVQAGIAPHVSGYMLVVMAAIACGVLVYLSPETSPRRPGLLRSLSPQIGVPRSVRSLMPAATCAFVATWALGGFYQAFGPSLAADRLGTDNAIVAALIFTGYVAPAAIGGLVIARLAPARGQLFGILAFAAAALLVLAALQLAAVVPFLLATLVAGTAQGAAFSSSVRSLVERAAPADRAEVFAVTYLISYTGTAAPGLVAGQLTRWLGLLDIAVLYIALVVVTTVGCVLAGVRRASAADSTSTRESIGSMHGSGRG